MKLPEYRFQTLAVVAAAAAVLLLLLVVVLVVVAVFVGTRILNGLLLNYCLFFHY